MKKHFSIIACLFLALSSFLVSCGDSKNDPYNGHEYVDLGLPSGIKWATCNVGATKPEEFGGYYAWGETEEKSNYDWSTYKWYNISSFTWTKYYTDSDYDKVDYEKVLDSEDDVAHVKWGGSWRMPTKEDIEELCYVCDWEWTTQNGVNGCKVTGPNDNSIFLPAAGCCHGTETSYKGYCGIYWSSSLYVYDSEDVQILKFESDNNDWYDEYYIPIEQCLGFCIRPVWEEDSTEDFDAEAAFAERRRITREFTAKNPLLRGVFEGENALQGNYNVEELKQIKCAIQDGALSEGELSRILLYKLRKNNEWQRMKANNIKIGVEM